MREGGPEFLAGQDLKKSSHLRGLNVKDQEPEALVTYLEEWLNVSGKLDTNQMSLLLHLPILLGYNHSSRIWDTWSIY